MSPLSYFLLLLPDSESDREKVSEVAVALAGAKPALPPANWSHLLMPLLQYG